MGYYNTALNYWAIDGLLKTKGKESYPTLIKLITTENCLLEVKAKAIKSIAIFSKQPFDENLPVDPSYRKVTDLQITAIIVWQQSRCPDGIGFTKPVVHPSTANPTTAFEKLVSKPDKKLAKLRKQNQYPANPSNWLVVADEQNILEIKKKWQLPGIYLLFLCNYSPLRVCIDSKKLVNGLCLYGANELIEAQRGCSYDKKKKETFIDWPKNFVVIGNDGGDSFCIDIAAIHEGNTPIYISLHGQGIWEFEKYADSFAKFLQAFV